MKRSVRGILLVAGILLLSAVSANAQAIGSIFGKVTDASGGVMPGVTVTVAGTGLQQPMVAVTGGTGTYQFPNVPIGTYSVTFELEGFKKALRPNIIISSGFAAPVDTKLEVGNRTEEVTVSAAPPVVDTKKVGTGGTFTKEILENVPTARDPWQIIAMTPGVQLSGTNVGGSASGQQLTPSARGTSANVMWNIEGGSITDVGSNSSSVYFNFDSFEQIQVVNGGGDVSVQSSGLSINLVTKSGSNVFKGSTVMTYQNGNMQSQNITKELFAASSTGFLSGNPLQKLVNNSVEIGGPIKKNRLWFWGAWDRQDIEGGNVNFFDATRGDFCASLVAAQKAGSSGGLTTFENMNKIQDCLKTDKTLIKDLQWKFNYQLNSSNKFQYLFLSNNKYRNSRCGNGSCPPTTSVEASWQQSAEAVKGVGYWGLPNPTHQVTHTWIASDRLVFNSQMTYVHGGFFLDFEDAKPLGNCQISTYLNTKDPYPQAADCLFNTQSRYNRTTSLVDRSAYYSQDIKRPTWEVKTDGTYVLTNKFGGDHSLKFGVGWRKAPVLTFVHYAGGAEADIQCAGNLAANCSATSVAPGAATGVYAYQAYLFRDYLTNTNWKTWNGYIQDSFSRGKLRINGGLRFDWQTSSYIGGCVAANSQRPDLLPAYCEAATSVDGKGKKIKPFNNLAPRLSVAYDLFGNGKTQVHASYSYYYATRINIASVIGGLNQGSYYYWGANQSNGSCSATAGSGCWQDLNRDTIVQVNELSGTPSPGTSRLQPDGSLSLGTNLVDPSTKIARTREVVAGVQHELIANLSVSADYIYRKYDRGSRSYTVGYDPLSGNAPLSAIYTVSKTWTDPKTGLTAPYYTPCTGCVNPSGLPTITETDQAYSIYHGVDLVMNKRFSNRWQANVAVTIQKAPGYQTEYTYSSPNGIEFTQGRSTLARFVIKINGAYQAPWGIMMGANLNINDGANRTLSITGPGSVYGGVRQTGAAVATNLSTLTFEPAGTTRYKPTELLDLNASKAVSFAGGKRRIKFTVDLFNALNKNTILSYSSNNLSATTSTSPSSLVAPRIFRFGLALNF